MKLKSSDLLIQQHKNLNRYLIKYPDLKDVIFQGQSLEYHASDKGMKSLIEAYEKSDFDPIALNHGIKRLRINSYNSDLIWDHPRIATKVEFNDEILDLLEKSYKNIKNETSFILDKIKKFPDSDDLVNQSGKWSYFPFYEKNNTPINDNHSMCPTISGILKNLDLNVKFGFAFISSLTKKSVIKPHKGSTSFRKRYHFGIIIPNDFKPKIRVGKEWIFWKEGKGFSFYDSVEHEVINESKSPRIILIFDIWSPSLPVSVKDFFKKDKDLINYAKI
jgi:hypothetical protein